MSDKSIGDVVDYAITTSGVGLDAEDTLRMAKEIKRLRDLHAKHADIILEMGGKPFGKTVDAIKHIIIKTKMNPGIRAAFVQMDGHWCITYKPNPTTMIVVDEVADIPQDVIDAIEKSLIK